MTTRSMCAEVRGAIEAHLHAFAARAGEPLRAAVLHALAGGKRARGLLLVASGEGVADRAPLLCAAACLELLHAATLVQDDIFDGSCMRRGRAATHSVFGLRLATLASDWMLAEAIRNAYRLHVEYGDALSACAQSMIAGEAREFTPNAGATLAALREHAARVAQGKTGELFGLAFAAAPLLSGDRELAARLASCGSELGTAFQYLDDALDLYGENTTAGKEVNRDLTQQLLTAPLLDALPLLSRSTAVVLLAGVPPVPGHVLEAMEAAPVREFVLGRARSQWHAAVESLERELPLGSGVEPLLLALAETMLPPAALAARSAA